MRGPAQNVADKIAKGCARTMSMPGERNPSAKLTATDVVRIRGLLAEGMTACSIARKFHVGPTTIQRIKHGTHWKDHPDHSPPRAAEEEAAVQ